MCGVKNSGVVWRIKSEALSWPLSSGPTVQGCDATKLPWKCAARLINYLPYTSSSFEIAEGIYFIGFLSCRHRSMRGKRSATPLYAGYSRQCLRTRSQNQFGFTVLTGPNFSMEFLLTNASTCANSLSVNPEYALVNVTSLSSSFYCEGVIGIEVAPAAMPFARIPLRHRL